MLTAKAVFSLLSTRHYREQCSFWYTKNISLKKKNKQTKKTINEEKKGNEGMIAPKYFYFYSPVFPLQVYSPDPHHYTSVQIRELD